MSQHWWKDDDQLLAALGEALRSERSVPAEFIRMGKTAFSCRGIDAELAAFTYDSVFDGAEAELAGVRCEPASLHHLAFTSGELTLEIEVTDGALLGQLLPPGPGRVEIRIADGAVVTTVIGQGGGFTIVRCTAELSRSWKSRAACLAFPGEVPAERDRSEDPQCDRDQRQDLVVVVGGREAGLADDERRHRGLDQEQSRPPVADDIHSGAEVRVIAPHLVEGRHAVMGAVRAIPLSHIEDHRFSGQEARAQEDQADKGGGRAILVEQHLGIRAADEGDDRR